MNISKKEIENKLILESKEFTAELNEVRQTIDSFREKFSAKSYPEYNNQIDSLKEKIRMMGIKKAEINQKQVDLDWNVEDFALLPQCTTLLKPFEEFWKAYAEVARNE